MLEQEEQATKNRKTDTDNRTCNLRLFRLFFFLEKIHDNYYSSVENDLAYESRSLIINHVETCCEKSVSNLKHFLCLVEINKVQGGVAIFV